MPHIRAIKQNLKDALLHLDSAEVSVLLADVNSASNRLLSMEQVMVPVLEEIGLDWENGRVSLSQVYMAGKICESVVDKLLLTHGKLENGGPRLAIAVLSDHHALGKRMVKSALHSAGYKMLDYGHGCQSRDLCEHVLRDKVDVLLISCLMLASAFKVEELVTRLQDAGSNTAVVVGGAPFRLEPTLYKKLGAKAMGRNSAEAVGIVQSFEED